ADRSLPRRASGTMIPGRGSASGWSWFGVATVWLAGLGALVLWLRMTSTGTLREQLKVVQFWSLEACVFLAVVVTVWTLARMRVTATKGDAAWLVVATSAAVALTGWAAP